MTSDLKGLFAAAHSPFDSDGKLAPEVVAAQADFHVEQGIVGVFVAGSTGEWPTLTADERRTLAEAWVEASSGRMKVFVHVGGLEQEESAALASHAQSLGVDAVAALCPASSSAVTASDVVDHLAPIAAAADATPFFYYDIPSLTGITVELPEVLAEGLDRMPTLSGAKYTDMNLAAVTAALDLAPDRLQILMGCDEMLLGALATGVKAAIGSTYNYAAAVYRRVMDAFDAGDMDAARAAQSQAVAMVGALKRVGVLGGGKAAMRWMGVDVGRPRQAADVDLNHADAFLESLTGLGLARVPRRA